MEQHALKNVNNCWNTSISFYLEISDGQSSNLYLNVVHFFNTSVSNLWQLKTVVFLHRCIFHAVLLAQTQRSLGNGLKAKLRKASLDSIHNTSFSSYLTNGPKKLVLH